MKINLQYLKDISQKHDIPLEDVILIALNRYGVIIEDSKEKRIRFRLKLETYPEIFYLAVCVNTFEESPFYIKEEGLFLNDYKVGTIVDREKDTCDTTYFRRNKTELTLNSNARSQCKGCKFCGTYNQDPEDMYQLDTEEKLSKHIEQIIKENNMKDLSNIVRVTVCTGCFGNENELIEHLKLVRKVLGNYKFDKTIRYIGSQIRSKEALRRIKEEIGLFSLSLTTECFTNRNKLMRNEKASLSIEESIELLDEAKKLGFASNILYILGLDELGIFKEKMQILATHFNRFPVVQVMQNYLKEQEEYRNKEAAEDLEYYLKARKILEDIFKDTNLHPRTWENYRSLFYTTYNGKLNESIKI